LGRENTFVIKTDKYSKTKNTGKISQVSQEKIAQISEDKDIDFREVYLGLNLACQRTKKKLNLKETKSIIRK